TSGCSAGARRSPGPTSSNPSRRSDSPPALPTCSGIGIPARQRAWRAQPDAPFPSVCCPAGARAAQAVASPCSWHPCTGALVRFVKAAYARIGRDFVDKHFSRERLMDSKRSSRRDILKGGATLAGGVALGVPVHAQTHDHSMAPASGSENAYPMIPGNKEMIAYGERSHFVTSVRIPHPMGSMASPDAFGKGFHVASPLQDSVGNVTPSSLHHIATTRQSFIPDIDPKQHTLMIHGLVDRPLTFTMEHLQRFT